MGKYLAYAVILVVLGFFTVCAGYRRDIGWKYGSAIYWEYERTNGT